MQCIILQQAAILCLLISKDQQANMAKAQQAVFIDLFRLAGGGRESEPDAEAIPTYVLPPINFFILGKRFGVSRTCLRHIWTKWTVLDSQGIFWKVPVLHPLSLYILLYVLGLRVYVKYL